MSEICVRKEYDAIGEIDVPANKYWGAQTERARQNFDVGDRAFPLEIIKAIALIKIAAARSNCALGLLDKSRAILIERAAKEVVDGKLDEHFPLKVWISGSGTQANMNVNEVVANRAIEIAGGELGSKDPVHPNDHVNMSQSSNDVIPSAICMASAEIMSGFLLKSLARLIASFEVKSRLYRDVIKVGRTHLQDAVPMTVAQELGAYAAVLSDNRARIDLAIKGLQRLALGGTAIGTGLNAPADFGERATREIAQMSGLPFECAPNRFAVMGSHDAMVMASGVLKTLAVSLYKIANDIRLLGSGPRSGLNELLLPVNEPGSSIMPGKVNPTQCESLAMICTQVMGEDSANAFAGAGGHLEMNVYKPLLGLNLISGSSLLSGAMNNFARHCIDGLEINRQAMTDAVERSLMLVTALATHIGYDQASRVALHAWHTNQSLKAAALELGIVDEARFDELVDPSKMT